MYETAQDPTAYAPWEYSTPTEVPELLRFPHSLEGHRHLAVGGVAAGPPGVGGGFSGGEAGAPAAAGIAGGVGAYVAAQAAGKAGSGDSPSGGGGGGGGEVGGGAAPGGTGNPGGGSSLPGGFGAAQPLDLFNLPVFRFRSQPSLQPGGRTPQKLSDMFFNRQSGGAPPASPTEIPRLPGRQGGPLEPAPVLTIAQRQACPTCGGDPNLELRAQRGELEQSIKTEREQLQTQTRQQQREQISRYQEGEQRGEPTTDQEIRDKLALLEQINQEIASQQQPQPTLPAQFQGRETPSGLTDFVNSLTDKIFKLGEVPCNAFVSAMGVTLTLCSVF